MPKDKKAIPRKKGKFGNLPLPVDVIDELREWKLAYEIAWSDPAPDGKQYNMTYEQLIRRLLEGVKRLDPEVWASHEAARKSREEQEEMMADFRRSFWSELKSTKKKLDGFYEEMMREIAAGGDSPAPAQEGVKEEEESIRETIDVVQETETSDDKPTVDGMATAAEESVVSLKEIEKNQKVPPEELNVILSFGKHKGKTVLEVYKEDPTYVTNFLPKANAQTIVLSSEAIEFLKESSKA